jgi:hypothetical protein
VSAWVDTYGGVDFVDDVARPYDALPPKFEAYTAVLHPLAGQEHEDVPWTSAAERDPWEQVTEIQEHGIAGSRYIADAPLSQPTARHLANALSISDTASYTVNVFFARTPKWTYTLTGDAMRRALDDIDDVYEYANRLNFWLPTDKTWVANSPFDMAITYIASSAEAAERLHDDDQLETLACLPPRKP